MSLSIYFAKVLFSDLSILGMVFLKAQKKLFSEFLTCLKIENSFVFSAM